MTYIYKFSKVLPENTQEKKYSDALFRQIAHLNPIEIGIQIISIDDTYVSFRVYALTKKGINTVYIESLQKRVSMSLGVINVDIDGLYISGFCRKECVEDGQ